MKETDAYYVADPEAKWKDEECRWMGVWAEVDVEDTTTGMKLQYLFAPDEAQWRMMKFSWKSRLPVPDT